MILRLNTFFHFPLVCYAVASDVDILTVINNIVSLCIILALLGSNPDKQLPKLNTQKQS